MYSATTLQPIMSTNTLVKYTHTYNKQLLFSTYLPLKYKQTKFFINNTPNTHKNASIVYTNKIQNNSYGHDYYSSIKTYKQRPNSVPVTLSRRLLRVRRTLVLPAHTNITIITNSYDVVHS